MSRHPYINEFDHAQLTFLADQKPEERAEALSKISLHSLYMAFEDETHQPFNNSMSPAFAAMFSERLEMLPLAKGDLKTMKGNFLHQKQDNPTIDAETLKNMQGNLASVVKFHGLRDNLKNFTSLNDNQTARDELEKAERRFGERENKVDLAPRFEEVEKTSDELINSNLMLLKLKVDELQPLPIGYRLQKSLENLLHRRSEVPSAL